MADVTYRGNLKSAAFPFLSELFGRTVIVKQQDQNFVGGLAAKESLDSSIGIPQIYYAQNVIPVDNGYKSVGYDTYTTAAYPTATGFNSIVTIRDGSGNYARLATSVLGNLYVQEAGDSVWAVPAGAPVAASIAGKRVSVALVSGITYIYFANVGCYFYDWSTNTLSPVTLAGLVAADIIGIVGNRGYLIAYSIDALTWSSTIDPTDFVPSLETGAGGGQVEGLRGAIVTIESVYGGMILFTTGNAVAVTASDNIRYPYNFNELTGCGGLQDANFVSYDANSGSLYAYTTSGMQLVTLRQATATFPEVTDFLSGGLFEDFNEATNELSVTAVPGIVIQKRIAVVADRYLILSYGATSLTHALYYDTAYKQWGRLKIDHTDCFEFERPNTESPKKSIAFLGAGGDINILNSDIESPNHTGVMILGKFQYVRSRLLQLQGVEFENVNEGDTFALYDLPSLDGKNLQAAVEGYLKTSAGKYRAYSFHNTALNHSILCKGQFTAVSFQLIFNVQGAR